MPKNNKLSCSYATQQKLAASLKELMESEQFEKLSVSDITSNCNLHRQTFYYHFDDKYELLDWIIFEELINPFVENFKIEMLYNKFYELFSTMSREKKFYQNSLRINTYELSHYISRISDDYIFPLVKNIRNEAEIKTCDETNGVVFSQFLSYGITGVVICWVQHGMKDSPEIMTKRIENIINNLKKLAVDRA